MGLNKLRNTLTAVSSSAGTMEGQYGRQWAAPKIVTTDTAILTTDADVIFVNHTGALTCSLPNTGVDAFGKPLEYTIKWPQISLAQPQTGFASLAQPIREHNT